MLSINPFQFFVSFCSVFIKFDTKFDRTTLLEISFLHFRNASLLHTFTHLAVKSDVLMLSSWSLRWSSSKNVCLGWCLRCGYSFASCLITFLTHHVDAGASKAGINSINNMIIRFFYTWLWPDTSHTHTHTHCLFTFRGCCKIVLEYKYTKFIFVEIACNKSNKVFNCYKFCCSVVQFTHSKRKVHCQPERPHIQRENIENILVKSKVISLLNLTLPYVWVNIHVWNDQC